MAGSLVHYSLSDEHIASIVMDDGKANAVSLAMLAALNGALDRALKEDARAVVLTSGRPKIFCGGFDLGAFKRPEAGEMVAGGFALLDRLYALPIPLVVGVAGHAIALGAFLVLVADFRIAVDSPNIQICANEVAIGLTLPDIAARICRQRISPALLQRFLLLAEPLPPALALSGGLLDLLVPASQLSSALASAALDLSARLQPRAFVESKHLLRSSPLIPCSL